jgi:hypothetical protein
LRSAPEPISLKTESAAWPHQERRPRASKEQRLADLAERDVCFRNLTDHVDGLLLGKLCLIMDCDGKFTPAFQTVLKDAGIEPLLLPPKGPNLNAYAERFVRSIKEECLDRMIFFGEPMLRQTIQSYVDHYHAERNHQGIDNQLLDPVDDIGKAVGEIVCRERLGGMLKFYYRKAA